MGGEIFVNEGPRGREKRLNAAGRMAINNAMPADTEPVEPLKFIAERFGVTRRQRQNGGLHGAPGLGSEDALVVAHLTGDGDFSRQGWTQGRT